MAEAMRLSLRYIAPFLHPVNFAFRLLRILPTMGNKRNKIHLNNNTPRQAEMHSNSSSSNSLVGAQEEAGRVLATPDSIL